MGEQQNQQKKTESGTRLKSAFKGTPGKTGRASGSRKGPVSNYKV